MIDNAIAAINALTSFTYDDHRTYILGSMLEYDVVWFLASINAHDIRIDDSSDRLLSRALYADAYLINVTLTQRADGRWLKLALIHCCV